MSRASWDGTVRRGVAEVPQTPGSHGPTASSPSSNRTTDYYHYHFDIAILAISFPSSTLCCSQIDPFSSSLKTQNSKFRMSDSGISHQKTEQRLIKGPLQSPMGPAKTVSYTQPVRLATEVSIMRCTTAPAPQSQYLGSGFGFESIANASGQKTRSSLWTRWRKLCHSSRVLPS